MTPSPGAMRAARAILTGPIWPVSDETLARIIDRETHAAELVAALKPTVRMFEIAAKVAREDGNFTTGAEYAAIACRAKFAIAAAEGRTILPADPTAFANVERPNVSPTEDR